MTQHTDVVVVGGGQAGLAAGYHLRRQGPVTILDADPAPGGSWQHMWDSLHLCSPAEHSSLPGRLMPAQAGETYPDAGHVVDYLTDYEVEADSGTWQARAVISATGSWSRPFLPAVPGRSVFTRRQLHTVNYRRPADFTELGVPPVGGWGSVIVVGGGNSGAQIAADLALDGHVNVTWVTQRPLRFLADDIDGRALFDVATARRRALDAGLLTAKPMFTRLTADGARWDDGSRSGADAMIWCPGFRPALSHLAPLNLRGPRGHMPTDGTRALGEPRLHLLGHGDWTGPASATLIGVGRPARDAARAIAQLL